MMEQKPIELYLISGFLGSGKTTFLRNLLEMSNSTRVGVLVNEFGSIGIDGKVIESSGIKLVEMNSGSIFCACLKTGFIKTLVAFLEQPIDILYIEASGMSDPSSIENLLKELKQFLTKRNITRSYQYKGSICLVDALRFLDMKDVLLSVKNQVKKSNLVIVNKIDQVTEDRIQEVHRSLSQLNSEVKIVDTSFGRITEKVIKEYLPQGKSQEGDTSNHMWNRPYGCIISFNKVYDRERINQFVHRISEKTLRLKGFVRTKSGIMRLDCVGDDIQIERGITRELSDEDMKIVVIGLSEQNLTQYIRETWESIFRGEIILEED